MQFRVQLAFAAFLGSKVVIGQTIENLNSTACDEPTLRFNNTNAAILADCLVNGPRKYDNQTLIVDNHFVGELIIPGVQAVQNVHFQGNITSVSKISMPDLQKIGPGTSEFTIDSISNLSTLDMPRLSFVSGPMRLNLLGGPAINLSFPNLATASFINIEGNIDMIDLPVLNMIDGINVTSTGSLNCTSFAAKVVNATPYYVIVPVPVPANLNTTVICVSPQGNVTTSKNDWLKKIKPNSSNVLSTGWLSSVLWASLIASMVVAL